ncbi:MAG: D-alanyl-D-alanine carboxypeptidase/D-alanyl-D-alanine-endopeptidase [bacterium]
MRFSPAQLVRALFFPARPGPCLRPLVPMGGFWVLVLLTLGACGGAEGGSDGVPLVFDVPLSQEQAVEPSSGRSLEVQDPVLAQDANTVPAGTRLWDQLNGYDSQLQGEVEAAVYQGLKAAKTHGKLKSTDCRVAAVVLDLARGKQLVALGSKRAQRPASNQKILTAIAALTLLGGNGSFETQVEALGTIEAGTLRGQLVLRAGGDPVYDRNHENAMPAWAMDVAQLLARAGIQRIEGDLVLDTGTYARPAPAPAWPSKGEHWQEYCALAGGFSANAGCLSAVLESTPGMLRVRVLPPGHGLKEEISVRKGPAKKALDVRVGVQGSRVIVGGTIPAGIPNWSARFAHPDPVALFGGALIFALGLHGVEVTGAVRLQVNAPPGTPLGAVSRPVLGQLEAVLLDSNNSVADQLFLTLGARGGDGSRAGSLGAVQTALADLRLAAGSLMMVDGSGLSRENRVTPRLLAGAMAGLLEQDPAAFDLFLLALPLAGRSGGLANRMGKGAAFETVRAKTGFIGGTSGLSGVALEDGVPRLAFSILVEYPRKAGLNVRAWKPMQDRIVQSLAAWIQTHPSPSTRR